jgi:hypothetical protein
MIILIVGPIFLPSLLLKLPGFSRLDPKTKYYRALANELALDEEFMLQNKFGTFPYA